MTQSKEGTGLNYIPPQEGIDKVVSAASAGKALKLKISDLKLQKGNTDVYGYFDVDPDNLDLLNESQRQLVNTIYGASKPGNRVYVLDAKYVKKALRGKEESAIARASRLDGADHGSMFSAIDWFVANTRYGLFGVLKGSTEDAAKK